MPTPLHQLGRGGPRVPALGFGLMSLTHATYGSIPEEGEQFKILDRALDIGATFWDSADLYGDGEELIGKWFKKTGKRDSIFLATKFGFVKGGNLEVDSSAAYCKKACAESLRLLGIDSIDLYYMHSANPETPIEETMRAMAELQTEGKIKHIGLSMVSSATLRRAYKIAPVTAVQTEYSIFTRGIEGAAGTDLLATCRELGVAVVIATPLGRGLLTSTFGNNELFPEGRDIRLLSLPRFQKDNREHNMDITRKLEPFAAKKGCSITQLAIAWLLKQGDDIFPIPGTKQLTHLEENWAVLDIRLSDAEEAEIRALAESVELAGGSVSPAFAAYLFRDTKEEST